MLQRLALLLLRVMVDLSIVMQRVEARDSAVSTLSAQRWVAHVGRWKSSKGAAASSCASALGQKGGFFLLMREYSKDRQNMTQLHQNLI